MLNIIAWYEILVGLAIIGLWTALLAGSGTWLLTTKGERAELLSMLALGALLYTTLNSPGYYADRDDWPTVTMFVVLAAATVTAAVLLLARIA